MTVYVSWNDRHIITEDEFLDHVTKDFDHGAYDDYFTDYLNDHYSALELFDLCENERDNIRDDFRDGFINDIMETGDADFEPYEL